MDLKVEKKLISLKEAAGISGYSADYIGQLIRAGKIPGKQVYSNVAWMTTAEAVMNYKNKGNGSDKNETFAERIANKSRRIGMEFGILKLFFQTFKSALPTLIILIISFLFLSAYVLYSLLNVNEPASKMNPDQTQEEILLF